MKTTGALTNEIRTLLKEQLGDSVWPREYPLFPGDRTSFKADIFIKGDPQIFVEVDEQQANPDTNVSKYWMYLEKNPDLKITLIHVFGEIVTGQNYKSRADLAAFIANKIEGATNGSFKYHPIRKELQSGNIVRQILKIKQINK